MSKAVLLDRAPGPAERRLAASLSVVYALLLLAVLPFGTLPAVQNPHVAGVSAAGVLFADLCTALLLASEYRGSGRASMLLLTCAYVYSAVMAAAHILTFPGAVAPGVLIGNPESVSWLFALWRGGMAVLLLWAVLVAARARTDASTARAARLAAALGATALAAVAFTALFTSVELPSMAGDRFIGVSLTMNWASVAVYAAAVVIIWRRGAFGDSLYLWLALVLVASATDLALSSASGARYTLGWYIGRASWVISSCVLLVFWLSGESVLRAPAGLRSFASYGAALCILLAAQLLHWFLLPWLGPSFPFATTFAAVAVAVWLGGWGPAAFTACVGYVTANVYFMEPFGSFVVSDPAHVLGFVLYCITCAVVIGLGEGMRGARDAYRRSELELKRRAAELQEADTNKTNFLAVLSHELRNPMAPIRNALALLRLSPDKQTIAQVAPVMERQLGNLVRLIDDLLDVSRIDRGKLEMRVERISLESFVKAALETAKPNIEAKSHELVVRYAADPVWVNGDPVRLSQIVANLLNNAAKFTPPRGHIEVTMGRDGGPDGAAAGRGAFVRVRDDGIGVPPEQLPSIFDMFVQLEAGGAQAAGGLGLGLTLARSIAAMHGGSVEARSGGAGKGSEFTLRLPLAAPAGQAAAREAEAPPPSGRASILVVDDNEDAASTLAQLLRAEGHEVSVAFGAAQALELARRHAPAIAFVDLNMPDMDGIELAARLRGDPRTRATRLVALTGMGQRGDIERTRAAGFEAHLTKPAPLEELSRLAAGAQAAVLPFPKRG